MYRLAGQVQTYAWGKVGTESYVAQMKESGEESWKADKHSPYAEYWFGTHPNGPSTVVADGENVDLKEFLASHPDVMGESKTEDGSLPYLFKILSIGKALSIQAHPDKDLAAKLHAARPDVYKDANHKPEMAVALTPFQAMCGFRPVSDIVHHLSTVTELRALVGEDAASKFEAASPDDSESKEDCGATYSRALRELFTVYATASEDAVTAATKALASRLTAATPESLSEADQTALQLCVEFPGDIGVFAPYLLNVLRLEPGQALFLAANEPHAYLSGDILEVMACSDNVVRAGLTPKLRDVDTLCSMLSYRAGVPDVITPKTGSRCLYAPPVPEFQLERVVVSAGEPVTFSSRTSAAVLLVLEGSATITSGESVLLGARGSSFLQAAGASATIVASSRTVLCRVQVSTSTGA